MKRYLMAILMTVILALGVVVGCRQEATPVPTTSATSVPTRTQDEICALVYNYLQNKAASMTVITHRMSLLDAIGIARPYFAATYQGNGKWQVRALGYGVDRYNYDGLWNLYEASGAIEPANDEATALLRYIQWWTR